MEYQRKISFKDNEVKGGKSLAVWVLSGVVLLAVIVFVVMSIKGQSASHKLTTADKKKQGEEVLRKFSNRVSIPQNEAPQVAMVTDEVSLHKKSPLYKDAKNGNYLIVTSQWVAIYDEVGDKIISMIPVKESN